MSSTSFPQRKGPSGPKAAIGGTIIRAGFDNTVPTASPVLYPPAATTPILRDGTLPLEVVLTGFKPGNVVFVAFSIILEDGSGEPSSYSANLIPVLDVGAGPLQITVNNILATIAQDDLPITWFGAILPVATADPKVQVWIRSLGADQIVIQPFGAWLAAMELDVASVTTLPSAILAPIP